jgi:hypothetical protein
MRQAIATLLFVLTLILSGLLSVALIVGLTWVVGVALYAIGSFMFKDPLHLLGSIVALALALTVCFRLCIYVSEKEND